jgi:hypothetical protein
VRGWSFLEKTDLAGVLYEFVTGGENSGLSTVVDPKLVEDIIDVGLYRVGTDGEQFGYLMIRVPFSHQTEDLGFPSGEFHVNGYFPFAKLNLSVGIHGFTESS